MPTDQIPGQIPAKSNSVRDLRAPVADAIAKLKGEDYDLDEPTRAYLISKVENSGFAGVIVDAHQMSRDGAFHLHASITKLFLLILLPFLLVSARAVTVSNMVPYAATGGPITNTGVPVLIGYAYIQVNPSFVISDNGTVSTNALTGYVGYSFTTNNFNTVSIYTKPSTNPAEGAITPGTTKVPIYAQVTIITTNNVTVGAKVFIP